MSEAHPLIHNHHHHSRDMSTRTIHFAPLPDPRLCYPRDDDTDDDDDDRVELDPTESSKNGKTLFQFSLSGGRRPSDTSSIASSSMHSLTPTQSIDSTTQPSRKARFLRLFKPKDKENSLTRWSSVNSFGPSAVSDQLFRTQSTTSYRGGNVRSPKSSKTRRPSTADGLLATLHNPRPAQRMLNGRVYGGGKNLFASAPDKEPEFVEWGYGGMGSVKSQREVGGRMWNKVQSESGITGDGDDDDGGGMTWVKRRREERERKAREEEAAQKSKDLKEAVAKEEAQKEHDLRAVNVPMYEDQDENDEDDDDSPTEDEKEENFDEDDDIISDSEARKTSLGAGVEKVSRHHKS